MSEALRISETVSVLSDGDDAILSQLVSWGKSDFVVRTNKNFHYFTVTPKTPFPSITQSLTEAILWMSCHQEPNASLSPSDLGALVQISFIQRNSILLYSILG